MRRVFIDDPLVDGATLVRDLYAPAGEVLARAGMRLSTRAVRALREHGVGVAFIQDAACADVTVHPLIHDGEADQRAAWAMRDLVAPLARVAAPFAARSTSRALEELKDLKAPSFEMLTAWMTLREMLPAFIERASRVDGTSGFLTERQANDDFWGHSVGVAILAVRIAADLGFSADDLSATASAALLHDVGLLMVPTEIRQLPRQQRTAAQARRYEDHTVLGEALLRPFAKRAPALPLVALEHHEHQSGGGYPEGIAGGNRVLRPASGPDAPRRIALVSEIVAVADRYERLISPQPGASALSPATARRVLAADAGPRLNAEVVGRFLDLLPPLPVGCEVSVTGDGHDGARALVTRLDPAHLDRPHVRVFATRYGARLEQPVDLVLAEEPSIVVAPVDEVRAA